MTVKSWLADVLDLTGYPRLIRWVLNSAPGETTVSAGKGLSVGRGARLRGDVRLGSDVTVQKSSILSGSIQVGDGADVGSNVTVVGDVSIDQDVQLPKGCIVDGTDGAVSIRRMASLGPDVRVKGPVEIGQFSAIGPAVTFQGVNHETSRPCLQQHFYEKYFERELPLRDEGGIQIGPDTWFGGRAIVLPGVTVGPGAVVGAGSVVTSDVDPYAVTAGVPAERKSFRFSESIRNELLELEWWKWSNDRIRSEAAFFGEPIETLDDVPER